MYFLIMQIIFSCLSDDCGIHIVLTILIPAGILTAFQLVTNILIIFLCNMDTLYFRYLFTFL